MGEDVEPKGTTRSITSEGLSGWAVGACWMVAAVLMGSGIAATFIAGTGAAPASMILFGSLFFVLALMRRVPLSLEVGGAKIDASYQVAEAFDAGREVGLQRGVEVALNDVEKAEESGEPPHVALERRRNSWSDIVFERLRDLPPPPSGWEPGYRGPVACNAAGITYRQLDYWARTGLVEPSVRRGSSGLYSEHDIVLLKVIKRLLDAGISLQQIRTAVIHLRERGWEDLERVTYMSDGQALFEATTDEQVIDLLRSGKGWFGISLGGVIREVEGGLQELSAEPTGPDDH